MWLSSRQKKEYYWFTLSKIILRTRLDHLFEQQKLKAIEHLVQNVAMIVNDQEGVRLFIQVINNRTSKDKKALIKQYKGHIDQIVKTNNVYYISVIKLITEIDDTVSVGKSFEQEISLLIPQILTCKKAFSLIFSLFSPRNNNFNILGKYQPSVQKSTCKKSEEVRKAELRKYFYTPLMQFLQNSQNLGAITKNPIQSKSIMGIYKSMQQDHHREYKNFLLYLLKYYLDLSKATIKQGTFDKSIIADGNGSKVVKSILLLQEDFVEPYCQQFERLQTKNAKIVLETKASFILLGIVQKGGRQHLAKDLISSGAKLDKAVAGQHFLKIINGLKK